MNLFNEWFNKYKCEVKAKDNIVTLSGVIASDSWGLNDDVINAKNVRALIDELEGNITIRLNSPGGSAFEGIEIYNYLKSIPNTVTVEVTGLVASAGTFICMGADKVLMNTGSQMMIHNAWTLAEGNAYELLQVVEDLETIDESIKSIYSERTGLDKKVIGQYMEEAKLWTAEVAIEKGFADGFVEIIKSGTIEDNHAVITNVDASKLVANSSVFVPFLTESKAEESKKEKKQNKVQKLFGGK